MTAADDDANARTLEKAVRRKIGRPPIYSKALGERVCNLIANGASLRQIEKMDGLPNMVTVLKWLADPDLKSFADHYEHAREARAEGIFEESLDIADDASGDLLQGMNGPIGNSAAVNRSKLMVDTRKWFLARLAPKKFGEQASANVQVNLSLSNLIGQSFTDAAGAKLVEELRGPAPGAVVEGAAREVEAVAAVPAKTAVNAAAKKRKKPVKRKVKK